MNDECVVLKDFFPIGILGDVRDMISSSDTRRLEFDLMSPASGPSAVLNAKEFAERETSLRFNYAILKWYRSADTYRSGAYDFHIDPPRFRSIPLFLCTLSGSARLEYINSKGTICEVECVANQVNLLQPTLRHRVTPPTGGHTERLFFFLGWNSDVEEVDI